MTFDSHFAQLTATLWNMDDREFEVYIRFRHHRRGLSDSLRRSYPTLIEAEQLRQENRIRRLLDRVMTHRRGVLFKWRDADG